MIVTLVGLVGNNMEIIRSKASKKQVEALKDPNSWYHMWPPMESVEERLIRILKRVKRGNRRYSHN